MKKRMAGYVRVSTPKQVAEGESLAVQEKRLKAEAQKRGWDLVVFREEGISGKDANRPAYQQMRADLESGVLDGAVSIKLDRFWRSLKLAITEIDVIANQWGRDLMTLDGMVDYTTPEKRLTTNIMAALAQWQREQQAERVTFSMVHRAENGLRCGGRIPYGFKLVRPKDDPSDGRVTRRQAGVLVLDKYEARRVKGMFDLVLAKGTTFGVCDTINKAGWRNRVNKPWEVSSVRRILSNPIYCGDLLYNLRHKGKRRPKSDHIRKPGVFPAIVSRKTFKAVEQLRADIKATYPPRSQHSPYLLSAMVFCYHCGGRMHGHINQQWSYYRCATAQHKGVTGCPAKTCIRADKLEDEVVERLFDFRTNEQALRRLVSQRNEERRAALPELRQRIGHLEGQLTKLAGRTEHIKDAYEDGAYSLAEMKRRLEKAKHESKELESALAQARAAKTAVDTKTTDTETVVRIIESAWDEFQDRDFAGRQQLLRSLIERVVIKDQHAGVVHVKHLDKLFIGDVGEQTFKMRSPTKTAPPLSLAVKRFLYERSRHQWPGQDQSQNERERQH